jgi:hypothetical protein
LRKGNPEPVTRVSPGTSEVVMLFVVELSCVVMVKAFPFKTAFCSINKSAENVIYKIITIIGRPSAITVIAT